MHVLLTGSAGFVGSHVLRHLLVHTNAHVVCPVTFRHKGAAPRLWRALNGAPEDWRDRVTVLPGVDLRAPIDDVTAQYIGRPDIIMNVASESHVDRSISDPGPFIANNVALMTSLLDFARCVEPRLFLQMSTDEVYGPADRGYAHREWDTILPSNPYSASKAAQEAICFSYWRTYGVPVVITNTMNIIGEMQDREKFVPKVIGCIRRGQPVPVHVSPAGVSGSRYYLHARNLADAWLYIAEKLDPQMYPDFNRPLRYHIVGEREVLNVDMVGLIADEMSASFEIDPVNFHESRPGHDLRYALDGQRLESAGWSPPVPFEESLRRTVRWTLDHPEWS